MPIIQSSQNSRRFMRSRLIVLCLVLLSALVGFESAGLAAESKPQLAQNSSTVIYLNDKPISQLQSPFTSSAMLYLPIKLLEHLGLRVELDPAKHSARLMRPGVFYLLKEGSRQITWNQQGMMISHAPIWQQDTLFVPRSLLANLAIGFSYNKYTNEIRIRKDLNTFRAVNLLPSDVYTRLVIEFEQPPVYHLQESDQGISIDFYGAEVAEPDQFIPEANDVLFKGLRIQQIGRGVVRLQIFKKYPSPHRLFWLDKPDRLMVDLVKVFQEEKTSQVAPGVKFTRTYQGFGFGPVTYYSLTIQPGSGLELEPELAARGRGFGKEPVSVMARRRHALAAINAGYFNNAGIPLGLLIKEGEFIASPIYGRTLLGVDQSGKLFIDQTEHSLAVDFPLQNHQRMRFNAVNLPRQNQQMVLYTPRYGERTGTSASDDAIELQILSDGTVQEIAQANLVIPEDGYVISAQGQGARWLKANAYVGMRALVYSQVLGQWEQVLHMVGGGPRLIKNGQLYVSSEQERFQPDIAKGRAPRTALGLGRKGEIILIVVDGRQALSKGLTLWELASLLKEKGAVEALNFDGGGSSAMVIGNRLVSHPSDGHERAVASSLVLVKR
jgi:uncharacterized protein YigE (DUF2233 family)